MENNSDFIGKCYAAARSHSQSIRTVSATDSSHLVIQCLGQPGLHPL
uniref:Uncharacterized protein n=1 Tax=Anguilla anguilla TaxID=7936 RepID=A0A0E9RVD7_ANGAN